MSELINITIDGKEVEVPEGEMIVESAKRVGVDVPIFCYHPLLKPVGMCRMCLVEVGTKQEDGSVRMMPKPQAACTLPASKNMVVVTDSETIRKDRKGVLEFLLINHPLDCPICDRGGECPLQNNTQFYGPNTSRYIEIKRHLPKAFPLSKHVTLDLERCIQCGRCVRFTEEISGDSQLAFLFRGANMQPFTYHGTEFDSKFSGNVIEICPVGALTSTMYRFRARPWDLATTKSVCTECSNGCNIWADHRENRLVRVNARENAGVNEQWACDKGKFGHGYLRIDERPGRALVRDGEQFVESNWSSALRLIAETFKAGTVAGLGGEHCSNEDSYMFQKLFRLGFGSNNLDHRMVRGSASALGARRMTTAIADIEKAKALFVFGIDLADEQPIVFLRVRKAWFLHGAKVVVASSEKTDADAFAEVVLRYKPGSEVALLGGLLHLLCSPPHHVGVVGESVAIPGGEGEPISHHAHVVGADIQGFIELKKSVAHMTPEWCEKETGVGQEALRRAAAVLSESPIALYGSLDPRVEDALASLAVITGGESNTLVPEAGSHGAMDMGVLPDSLPGLVPLSDKARFEDAWGGPLVTEPGLSTEQILKAAADGKVKALFLNCCDPLTEFPDRALAEKALENVEFLVVHHFRETESHAFASVILPAQAFTERDATFTNVEGRVQRVHAGMRPVGEAKSPWSVFAELLAIVRPSIPPFSPAEVMDEVARLVPAYAECTYDKLGDEGVRASVAAPTAPRKVTAIATTTSSDKG